MNCRSFILNARDCLFTKWEISEFRERLLDGISKAQERVPSDLVKIFKFALWNIIFGFPAIVIWLGLVLGKKLLKVDKIYFYGIVFYRIGHLIMETDLFLRRQRKLIGRKEIVIGFGYLLPASNHQILKMYRRHMPIIDSMMLEKILRLSFLRKTKYLSYINFDDKDYAEFNDQEPILSLTEEEREKGESYLRKMGIMRGDWFVCFHSRDRAYLGRGSEHHDFRDCDVENYLPAAEYIAKKGGFAIRMGAVVDKALPNNRNSRIIDYAVGHRSDFMDVYLLAKCKYFLGVNSGLMNIPTVFGVPVASANVIPVDVVPVRSSDLYITKKMWDIKNDRFITYPEIFNSKLCHLKFTSNYEKEGIRLDENTSEEILELAIEMNDLIDGKFKMSEQDEVRRNKYLSLLKPEHHSFGHPARVACSFLSRNNFLLGNS